MRRRPSAFRSTCVLSRSIPRAPIRSSAWFRIRSTADLREDPPPQAFVPIAQFPVTAQGPGMAMLIASRDPAAAQLAVRRMLDKEHPGIANAVLRLPAGHPRPSGRRSHDGQAVRFLRRSRGSARGRWTARTPFVLPRPAPQRDRHSHGARSESRSCRRCHAAQCLRHAAWLA